MSDGVGLSRTNRGPIRYDRSTLIPVTRLTIFPFLHPINPLHEYLFLFFTSLSLCLTLTQIYHVHVVNPVYIHHPYLHLYIPSISNQVSAKVLLCYSIILIHQRASSAAKMGSKSKQIGHYHQSRRQKAAQNDKKVD